MKRNIVLTVSLAVAVLAAIVTHLYLTAREAELVEMKEAFFRKNGGKLEVLCFLKDTPGGTMVSKKDLGTIVVPANGFRGQALTMENLGDVVNHRTVIGHQRGDIVFWSDIEGGEQTAKGLASDIRRSMRAMSINCSGASSVSGMVRPNDHVDVIGTFSFPDKGDSNRGETVTCTMLQNVLVLATGQTTAHNRGGLGGAPSQLGYSTVTLLVTPREAEMLAFTEQMKGRLTLTLRGRTDTSYEKELPKVDFEKIRGEIETLNNQRQQQKLGCN